MDRVIIASDFQKARYYSNLLEIPIHHTMADTPINLKKVELGTVIIVVDEELFSQPTRLQLDRMRKQGFHIIDISSKNGMNFTKGMTNGLS